MAKVIGNDLERFRDDITQFSESLERMHSTANRVFEELASLNGMWEGSAHQVFNDQFLADADNMENLYQFLKRYLSGLEEDARRFSKCESDIDQIIKNIQI